MSCRPHDTSSGDGGVSDECEISANSAKMQELSPKCRKIKQAESVRKRQLCSKLLVNLLRKVNMPKAWLIATTSQVKR